MWFSTGDDSVNIGEVELNSEEGLQSVSGKLIDDSTLIQGVSARIPSERSTLLQSYFRQLLLKNLKLNMQSP